VSHVFAGQGTGGRLIYMANARLPTEKAHGFQIMKMCEAFAAAGMAVTLYHPYRKQANPFLAGTSPFDYYGVEKVFDITILPNWDVVPIERYLPTEALKQAVFLAHAFAWARYAVQAARRLGADLYFTRDIPIAFWLVKLGLPTIFEAHAVPGRGQRWLLGQVCRSRHLSLLVALTPFIRERLERLGLSVDKGLVAPDAVDMRFFENLPNRLECRRRLGLPSDQPIVGYVGRFHTMGVEKGLSELIEASALLVGISGKGPLLICVGGPMDAMPKYMDLARRRGLPEARVRFIDRVPNHDVPLWMRSFDLAVAPFPATQHYAYFMSPLKVFEYMAAGVPIVASDLPSLREVLHDGKNALLVEPGDPGALAKAIATLLENPAFAGQLARAAQDDVRSYTWDRRARSLLDAVARSRSVNPQPHLSLNIFQ
jgi:glycosyltransferase involved in cell wall biosynthesis